MPKERPAFYLYWVKDRSMYRVGRSDWAPDAFQVLLPEQYDKISAACNIMSIPFYDNTDGQLDEE